MTTTFPSAPPPPQRPLAGATASNLRRVNDPTAPTDTRTLILRSAERLFAEHGIDGASLREINRAAGQSNTGAVQYYFGGREGLVLAVIARHRHDDEIRRHTLLDEYERAGVQDRRALAAALVIPLAAKLDDADGGRRYLQISAEYYLHASREEAFARRIPDESVTRWHHLLDELDGVNEKSDPLPRLAPRAAAIRLALIELSRRAADKPRPDDRLFVSYLIDLVTSLLSTTMSPESTRLREKKRRRTR
jgi:AcrR family transcriptional regulator